MKKLLTLMIAASALASCSVTLPVRGISDDGSEIFTGTATGGADGAGHLQIVSSRGLTCAGDSVYTTSRQGSGVFLCSNGQGGPFEFASTGMRGTGTGRIGKRTFVFTFG